MYTKQFKAAKLQDRKVVKVSRITNKSTKPLLSTAINTKEKRRQVNVSTSTFRNEAETKKQTQLVSNNQLAECDAKIPYARSLVQNLKSVESHFLTHENYRELTLFSLFRLRFVKKLKEAKVQHNLLEETIYLAIHLYDRYFMLEKSMLSKFNKIKLCKETTDILRCIHMDSNLIRPKLKPKNEPSRRYRTHSAIYSNEVSGDIPAQSRNTG